MDLIQVMRDTESDCTMGKLPACAPLANPYVPFQQNNPQTYKAHKGLVRGTMYPGLDLPFRGMVNEKEKSDTPLHQLQAMRFAVSELGLYLDTHPEDKEATALFNQYVEQYAGALQMFERKRGSLEQMDSAISGTYEWIQDPWPWEYSFNKEA